MRTLILMRGAPGCGKSTWIREMGLEDYALSADKIRLMHCAPLLEPDETLSISQRADRHVWDTLFRILEFRMERGCFTVIDACNSKTSEMQQYKELAQKYRYRIFCVDMTDIPMDVVKERNALRSSMKIVPEEYIERVYSRFETQSIPSGIQPVRPDAFWETVGVEPFDLSSYNRVIHIGDVHGCYDTLMTALDQLSGANMVDHLDPEAAYIFLGDYIDRGPDSAKVIEYLLQICEKPNVCLLEGNHEIHLWRWANGLISNSRYFEEFTRPQLEQAGIDKKAVRQLCRRMRQCSYYMWRGKNYLCTHGGISDPYRLNYRLDLISAYQMIHGVGRYEDMEACCESFRSAAAGFAAAQIFGHRNDNNAPACINEACACLEGGVERGGELRTLVLMEIDGAASLLTIRYPNPSSAPVKPAEPEPQALDSVVSKDSQDIKALIDRMRASKYIFERSFGHFSSFNFTRDAFYQHKWNDLTTKARGLFIDTVNHKVLARGYEKFFAVDERQNTKLHALKRSLQFPVMVHRKENGFLGLVSYDQAAGKLFVSTKGTPVGPMADRFRELVHAQDGLADRLEAYLKEHDVTLLFEVIDPVKDPHIIKYYAPELILLDIVDNSLAFNPHSQDELAETAFALHVPMKSLIAFLNSPEDLEQWYEQVTAPDYKEVGGYVEGYVLRDQAGFMVKVKTAYYTQWKKLRSVAQITLKHGHYQNTAALRTPLENYFYAWAKSQFGILPEATDIITLRDLYYQSHEKEGVPVDPQ